MSGTEKSKLIKRNEKIIKNFKKMRKDSEEITKNKKGYYKPELIAISKKNVILETKLIKDYQEENRKLKLKEVH